MLFLPRRFRIICFFVVTPWQIGVILTANYTFLNYLVLALALFLVDDRFLVRFVPKSLRAQLSRSMQPIPEALASQQTAAPLWQQTWARHLAAVKLALTSVMFIWLFYSSTVLLLLMLSPGTPLPYAPVAALQPFRVADRYGLFAVMTRGRYEIEFQGSNDSQNWTAYPFRYKPQDPSKPPRIYAPYQPRFDWNLWFASLSSWRQNPIVPNTEIRLLENDKDVLALFAGNPFPQSPPKQVRAVLWQYWFTSMAEKRATGMWWKRKFLGLYAPSLQQGTDGRIQVMEMPDSGTPNESSEPR
jgi:hypothetical protein